MALVNLRAMHNKPSDVPEARRQYPHLDSPNLPASDAGRDFADRVIVLTERNVSPVELYNASFLDSLKELDPEADAAARRAMRRVRGGLAIREVVKEIDMGGRGFRAVGRLLRQGELALTKVERITAGTVVCRTAA